jgi:hypothetical protein
MLGVKRFLAAYFDTNGVGRLAGEMEFESFDRALAHIADIEARQTKTHKVDYRVVEFDVGHKLEAMQAAGIAT